MFKDSRSCKGFPFDRRESSSWCIFANGTYKYLECKDTKLSATACSGIICATGPDCKPDTVGDNVCFMTNGGSTLVVCQ